MSTNNVLLTMRDVHIDGYSDDRWHHIIKGIDVTLKRGEILGLIDESGAGKSTLGLAAMGFARPGCKIVSGSIEFDGIDLLKLNHNQLRSLNGSRIAYVAQPAAASFNPAHRLINQNIESSVSHGIADLESAKQDAIQLYRDLQLPDPEHIGQRYPHQVSGGQLQRIMTAIGPDLIIFDEPTTALDVTTQVEVLSAMHTIVEKYNTAAVYITHDLAVVAQMADSIKVLRYGETVEDAPTRQMMSDPQEAYTQSLCAVRAIEKPLSQLLILFLKSIRYMLTMARALRCLITLVLKCRAAKL